jgi:hypothetical protein
MAMTSLPAVSESVGVRLTPAPEVAFEFTKVIAIGRAYYRFAPLC